jgi:hypothetical protein
MNQWSIRSQWVINIYFSSTNFEIFLITNEGDGKNSEGWDDLRRGGPPRHRKQLITQILSLKEQLKKDKGFDVDTQKIVFKGKTVNNTDVISSLGVKENDFMVLMVNVKSTKK